MKYPPSIYYKQIKTTIILKEDYFEQPNTPTKRKKYMKRRNYFSSLHALSSRTLHKKQVVFCILHKIMSDILYSLYPLKPFYNTFHKSLKYLHLKLLPKLHEFFVFKQQGFSINSLPHTITVHD